MTQNLGSNEAEHKVLKNSFRILVLVWSTIVQLFCNPMKKCSLLVLLPLLLLLLLLIFVSHHGIWPVAQIAHADLSGFDNGSGSSIFMHNTPVLLDGLFGYYYYIHI